MAWLSVSQHPAGRHGLLATPCVAAVCWQESTAMLLQLQNWASGRSTPVR